MNQTLLKLACFAVVAGIIAMLGYAVTNKRLTSEPSASATDQAANRPINRDITLGSFGETNTDLEGGDDTSTDPGSRETDNSIGASSGDGISLRVGVISATPRRTEVTSIASLPSTISEVRRLYRDSEGRTCRVLIPGTPVSESHARTTRNAEGTFGRVPTFTIGLEMNEAGRSKLPAVVRTQVEKYFRDHRLSVQPTLYHDREGKLYFGTDCQTAFYEIDRPGITVKAEPMVDTAVGRFRALGIVGRGIGRTGRKSYSDDEQAGDTVLGRTLAMAFTFERSNQTAFASDRGRNSMELLLLHLSPDATIGNPEISVFVTSDDLETLHRLDVRYEQLNSPIATITAQVRFASTVLLGLYPANPVVTEIRYRSEAVLAMESIRRATLASGDDQPLSVTEILDRFGEFSQASSQFAGDSRLPGFGTSSLLRDGQTERYQDPTLTAPLPKSQLRTGL